MKERLRQAEGCSSAGVVRRPERPPRFLSRSPEDPEVHPKIQDMELQKEKLRRPLPKGAQRPDHDDDDDDEEEHAASGERPAPPTSLPMSGSGGGRKKRLVAPAISLTLERSDSVFSDDYATAALSPSPDDDDPELDINLEDMDTPSDSESFGFPDSPELDGDFLRLAKGGASRASVSEQADFGNMELDQVDADGRRWRRLSVSGQECYVNMSVIQPYLRVLSHGRSAARVPGYYGDGLDAIIVFSSCYLPDNTIENYPYIIDNLFRYIVGTLELMVSEDYVIVYLCSMAPRTKLPSIKWLRQCYATVERRLRKNLKGVFFVHPVWYIKVLLTIVKAFTSAKFSRKVRFIRNLQELSEFIPMEHVNIPDHIRQYDQTMEG
ncbi:hypothetical protein ANANG_G00180830 [Anguilla anguilla]|uniref:CRAL-TRIO domain-containing protein n=1 Tax=Anguilla anguilla TaxID=7936 RepID=A0A9D3M573_ANGAN|nr:hypothetical protein ANANG_G00180830 [Anguilla anguilla]